MDIGWWLRILLRTKSFGGGGGGVGNFKAGAVPKSTYELGNQIGNYTNYLQSLYSQPQSVTNWALGASGATPGGQTYATNQDTSAMGSNAYYQAAAQQYQQLGANAENLLTQGAQQAATGGAMLQSGADIATQGRNAFQQGQNVVTAGQNLVNQGVSGAYTQGVQQLDNIVAQYPQIQSQLNQLPSYRAIMSTGLTPEQQAYVTQATQAQQAAVTQQLQSEGLGSSTMMAEKIGAAQQAGAATAGSLIQGNIQAATQAANAAANAVQEQINQEQARTGVGQQLISGGLGLAGTGVQQQGVGANVMQAGTGLVNAGTNYANVGVSEQQLGLSSQSKGMDYINTIATANTNMQQQLYSEAMQGYGVLGKFIDQTLSAYGLSVNVEQVKGGESTGAVQATATEQAAQQQSDSKGFSTLVSGLGTAAAAYAGSAAGSAAIGGALSAAGALFCAAGREIFGVENPEWYLMRDVMLFRAPKWFRKAYIRHAQEWALYLSTRPRLKGLVRIVVRRILATLTKC